MRFQTPDGDLFEGETYQDVVERMADMKMSTPRSRKSYRKATARRVADAYDDPIDSRTDETFIKSLVDAGLLFQIG